MRDSDRSKPGLKPEPRPDPQPAPRPVSPRVAGANPKSGFVPDSRPASGPDPRTGSRSDVKPALRPEAKANSKADTNAGPEPGKAAGRIVHDDRGNAVWDWIAETGRILIDNTSRLLKRLDAPDLKVEDQQELNLESDRDAAGGYDPYGRPTDSRRSTGGKTGAANGRGSDLGTAKPSEGGGYDPYSSGGVRKPRR